MLKNINISNGTQESINNVSNFTRLSNCFNKALFRIVRLHTVGLLTLSSLADGHPAADSLLIR